MTLADIDKQLSINASVPTADNSTNSAGGKYAEIEKMSAEEVKKKASADNAEGNVDVSKLDFSNLESLPEVRSLIEFYKAKVEKILARQAQLRNANRKLEADALDVELNRYSVLIDFLEGKKAELKSKSMVISTAIERAKLNKKYNAPES